MPYRELEDDGGTWMVFSTQPRAGANVRPQYAGGWLSFQRGTERRRLAPIPAGWEHAGDDQLGLWLARAEVVAQSMDEEEMFARMSAEPEGVAPDTPVRPDAGDLAAAARPGRAHSDPARPASRVQKSVERIRAMLSEIRPRKG